MHDPEGDPYRQDARQREAVAPSPVSEGRGARFWRLRALFSAPHDYRLAEGGPTQK
jgi:hypothetical protein